MQYTLFTGCSYTCGTGLDQEKLSDALWVNILFNNSTKLKQTQLLNVAISGRSNAGIFADAVYNLTKHDCKYAFVEWTNSPRYELDLGLEIYETRQCFIPNAPTLTHRLNSVTYDSKYLDSVRDRFTSLAHLHYEIQNLMYYVNSLIMLADLKGTKIFFINGLCPWDLRYFNKLTDVLPSAYTEFTKELINVDNRDDTEIYAIYEKMHDQYNKFGNIQSDYWLNLYRSMQKQKIDTTLDLHPGKLSNQLYADQFAAALTNKL